MSILKLQWTCEEQFSVYNRQLELTSDVKEEEEVVEEVEAEEGALCSDVVGLEVSGTAPDRQRAIQLVLY